MRAAHINHLNEPEKEHGRLMKVEVDLSVDSQLLTVSAREPFRVLRRSAGMRSRRTSVSVPCIPGEMFVGV